MNKTLTKGVLTYFERGPDYAWIDAGRSFTHLVTY